MSTKKILTRVATQSLLVTLLCFTWLPVLAQSTLVSQQVDKSPGEWKTFVVTNADELKIPAPPGKEQTLKELRELKEKISKRDDQMLQSIRYWDAGSPAYRWNQLGYRLTSFENFNVFLRTPSAWMNMAIYDATVAAWKTKYTYQRKRPAELDPSLKAVITAPSTPSYPCEHTVTAAAAATVLAYFYPEKADSIKTGYTQQQLDWLKKDLSFVSNSIICRVRSGGHDST